MSAHEITWVPWRKAPRLWTLYECHFDNFPFDEALDIFRARSTKVKATIGNPRAYRCFVVRLKSGRHAAITNYDDFPYTLGFLLQLDDPGGSMLPIAYMADLCELLAPLCLPIPDKSNVGFPRWI